VASQDFLTPKNQSTYSDIFINLNMHPGNNQLARHTNENAVKRSIKSLVLTAPNERLFQPDIKCEIRRALFEPMDAIMGTTIKTLIEQVIKNHEPRANLLDVIVKPDYDNQAYEVTILFAMINIPDPVQLSLKLSRIR
jgi:hypothetical protein